MPEKKKIYFASDFHLGLDTHSGTSEGRERIIVRWLDFIQDSAKELYLVGDIFDFWFEYKSVIPKGFRRFLGKISELRDANIPIYFFVGNHDMWMFNYFTDEFGIPIIRKSLIKDIQNKKFFIAHGDGLGPGDYGYKMVKSVLSNKWCQWFYARVHPNTGLRIMKAVSKYSRSANRGEDEYLGDDKEWLYSFSNHQAAKMDIDYFVFGHRHLPIDILLVNKRTRYINLGDWITFRSYAEFFEGKLNIRSYENNDFHSYP